MVRVAIGVLAFGAVALPCCSQKQQGERFTCTCDALTDTSYVMPQVVEVCRDEAGAAEAAISCAQQSPAGSVERCRCEAVAGTCEKPCIVR